MAQVDTRGNAPAESPVRLSGAARFGDVVRTRVGMASQIDEVAPCRALRRAHGIQQRTVRYRADRSAAPATGRWARSYRLSVEPTCDAGDVANYRVRFEGPAALGLRVATALADADGVDLISSDQPVTLDNSMVALNVMVEGAFDAVADAVASIRGEMPSGASIEMTSG